MTRLRLLLVALVLALALAIGPTIHVATLAQADDPGVARAVEYLSAQIQPEGGVPGFDGSPDASATADVAVALAAAGVDPSTLPNGQEMIGFLATAATDDGAPIGRAAKLALAASALGQDPRSFGGADLIARIEAALDPETGLYDEQLFVHALAMLALSAAGAQVPDAAIQGTVERQIEDGSWAFAGTTEPGDGDSNTTAMVIQALVAAGAGDSPAIERALDYLEAARTEDGAFVYAVGAEDPPLGDANSTALAIQALIAAGEDLESERWADALDALRAFQNESGAFRYRDDFPDDNLLATAQAVPALAGRPLPIVAAAVAERQGRTLEEALAAAAPGAAEVCIYFEETRHNVCHGFRAFFERHGGVEMFGRPLTEEFDHADSGLTVQYFENARFEWRPGTAPERYDVWLGPLGSETIGRP